MRIFSFARMGRWHWCVHLVDKIWAVPNSCPVDMGSSSVMCGIWSVRSDWCLMWFSSQRPAGSGSWRVRRGFSARRMLVDQLLGRSCAPLPRPGFRTALSGCLDSLQVLSLQCIDWRNSQFVTTTVHFQTPGW
jgi:hypothetical protein